ncbi:hypothetical protein GUJ93_ZPchr0004g40108 [Zizania palustris]|uniref:Uncharacterized protein n=1 Tax=Zizania palustris TaxID=103762 RepID=A0A8J5T0F8_ZIZPA|nr:hypothetical protein GUJ93_ZPchr0004g40108 [Zizania palustris]
MLTGIACPYPYSPDPASLVLAPVHAVPRVAYLISDRIYHRLLSTRWIYLGINGSASASPTMIFFPSPLSLSAESGVGVLIYHRRPLPPPDVPRSPPTIRRSSYSRCSGAPCRRVRVRVKFLTRWGI